jgi:nitroimidazol reductase NimA-like FMN-containing flavoprotein (pyridoxamine 5'-phosphate oxidase superfamily)
MVDRTDGDAPDVPVVEHLDKAESLRLISTGGIGRIGFTGRFGPAVLPVNYKVHDGTIVFRTALGSPMDEDLRTGIAGAEYQVAFEIIHETGHDIVVRWRKLRQALGELGQDHDDDQRL